MGFLDIFFDNDEALESIDFEIDSDVDDVLGESSDNQVLYALDRMTNDIDEATYEEAAEYFQIVDFDQDSFNGILSNWKGIHGEIRVLDELNMRPDFDAHYVMPDSTTHEDIDIYGVDENGNILEKFQVKMSLDKNYIEAALNDLPDDVKIICPSEIADKFDSDRVIDIGVRLTDVETEINNVCEVLSSTEPWEEVLGDKFDNWLEEDFEFDFSKVRVS